MKEQGSQDNKKFHFYTRKWYSVGGMEQFSKDLWEVFKGWDDFDSRLHKPLNLPIKHRESALNIADISLIWSLIFKRKPDYIHLADVSLIALGRILKFLHPKAHISIAACGLDVVYPKKWYQWIVRRWLPKMDCVVCISNATAEEVHKRGVPLSRIVFVPCGIWPADARELKSGINEDPVLVTVGRLVDRKGVAWFIENVMPKLIEKYPNIKNNVVGSGPEEKVIRSLIEKNNMTENVHLLGQLNHKERNEELLKADLFVMPGISIKGTMEGFGIVCIEASVRGVPVLGSKLEGEIDAMQEGKTGRFYEPENAQDCFKTCCEMINNPMDPKDVSNETLKVYDWNLLAQRYRDEVFKC